MNRLARWCGREAKPGVKITARCCEEVRERKREWRSSDVIAEDPSGAAGGVIGGELVSYA